MTNVTSDNSLIQLSFDVFASQLSVAGILVTIWIALMASTIPSVLIPPLGKSSADHVGLLLCMHCEFSPSQKTYLVSLNHVLICGAHLKTPRSSNSASISFTRLIPAVIIFPLIVVLSFSIMILNWDMILLLMILFFILAYNMATL